MSPWYVYRGELVSLPVGNTLSTHHKTCPASGGKADTKKRLRFTRIDRSTVLYMCHHCGIKGRARVRGTGKEPITGHDSFPEPVSRAGGKLPTGHSVMACVPTRARDWLDQAGITGLYDKGIVWNDNQSRLIMPCYGREGDLLGYQARGFDVDPKYITKQFGSCLYNWHGSGDTLVIVEDILSSIRVGGLAGYTGVALLRTTLSKCLLLEVLKSGREGVIVWLDNDNPTVRKLARRLVHTLEGYGLEVRRVSDRSDPKHYTDEQLIEILNEDLL